MCLLGHINSGKPIAEGAYSLQSVSATCYLYQAGLA